MQPEPAFLGWDGHALPRAAAWLIDRFGDDLSRPIVVTPTGRSRRRLLELLVEQRAGALDAVPKLVTPANLPELLYDAPDLADDWTAALLRLDALRRIDPDVRSRIVPVPPDEHDLAGWWTLAQRLASVTEDAAASGLTLDALIERIERTKLDDRALDRLDALRQIEAAYLASLQPLNLHDKQRARLDAIAARACRCDRPIVLVAAADLTRQLALMLDQVTAPVQALVHAPPEAAAGFDRLGRFVADHWLHHAPPIDDAHLHFVDRPADQARQVVATLAAATPSTDDVTIGLADPTLAATVRRAVEHAGAQVRDAAGRPLLKSRPATLLRALGRFAGSQRFDDFAALLRHPDLLAHLGTTEGVEDWLSFLDEYASRHLQQRLAEPWLGERRAAMSALWSRVAALLPSDAKQPLAQWAQPIAGLLQTIYPGELSRHAPHDHDLFTALQLIGEALAPMAQIAVDVEPVNFAQAVTLLLQQIATSSVPELPGAGVEMMGLLELPLDDANHLVLVGVNESHLPGADPWLPDSMRRALGMPDATARLARDCCLLTAILHSRHVTLIAGRVTADGDPLAPSRLLLMGDDSELVRRVSAFYAHDPTEQRTEPPLPLAPGSSDLFLIPPPALDAPKVRELSVTAFRDYLACPYRFYLKHVLKLRSIDDRAGELDALAFGNLAHDVMKAFAESDERDSTEVARIERFLSDRLDLLAKVRYGDEPRMAIRLQVEQLRTRLTVLALKQAQMRNEGWRITAHERDMKAALTIDGEPFTITGRVDRIDRHDDRGYRILDYKTGETGSHPDKTHRHAGAWIDLQLPLYRDLCAAANITGPVALGYVNLPKRLEDIGPALAEWDDALLDEAVSVRDRVIRSVIAGVFWPPGEPREDEFAAIAADLAFDRAALIKASEVTRG